MCVEHHINTIFHRNRMHRLDGMHQIVKRHSKLIQHYNIKYHKQKPVVFYGFLLFPGEADHAHDVDDDDRHGNNIAEDGFHPVSDL